MKLSSKIFRCAKPLFLSWAAFLPFKRSEGEAEIRSARQEARKIAKVTVFFRPTGEKSVPASKRREEEEGRNNLIGPNFFPSPLPPGYLSLFPLPLCLAPSSHTREKNFFSADDSFLFPSDPLSLTCAHIFMNPRSERTTFDSTTISRNPTLVDCDMGECKLPIVLTMHYFAKC